MPGALVGLLLTLAACTSASREPTPVPPTAAPVVLATPVPTAPPPTVIRPPVESTAQPSPTAGAPTPLAAAQLYVFNTGGQGLTMRQSPGGEPIGVVPDGGALTPTGELEEAAGRRWTRVRDAQGREGWVAAEFLTATAPAPSIPTSVVGSQTATAVPVTGGTATPFATRVVTPVSRVTPTTAVAVPVAPPSILAPPAPKPQGPPASPKPAGR